MAEFLFLKIDFNKINNVGLGKYIQIQCIKSKKIFYVSLRRVGNLRSKFGVNIFENKLPDVV